MKSWSGFQSEIAPHSFCVALIFCYGWTMQWGIWCDFIGKYKCNLMTVIWKRKRNGASSLKWVVRKLLPGTLPNESVLLSLSPHTVFMSMQLLFDWALLFGYFALWGEWFAYRSPEQGALRSWCSFKVIIVLFLKGNHKPRKWCGNCNEDNQLPDANDSFISLIYTEQSEKSGRNENDFWAPNSESHDHCKVLHDGSKRTCIPRFQELSLRISDMML